MTPRRLPPPNYTQAPNLFLDDILPEIGTLAELKVTLVVIRQTIGWQEDEQKLTFSELERRTGLARSGVNRGVQAAIARGTVERRVEGEGSAREAYYALSLLGSDVQPSSVAQRDQARLQDATKVGSGTRPAPIEKETGKQTPPVVPLASEGDIELWGKVLEDLASCVTATTFNVWLGGIRLERRDGDELVLSAPRQTASWVRDRYLKVIERAAARAGFGPAVTVTLPLTEEERARIAQDELARRRPRRRRAA